MELTDLIVCITDGESVQLEVRTAGLDAGTGLRPVQVIAAYEQDALVLSVEALGIVVVTPVKTGFFRSRVSGSAAS